MARQLPPRARDARRRSAETVGEAAALLEAGEPLTDVTSAALVQLLRVLQSSCETVSTLTWDRVAHLANEVTRPHWPPAPPARPLLSGYDNISRGT